MQKCIAMTRKENSITIGTPIGDGAIQDTMIYASTVVILVLMELLLSLKTISRSVLQQTNLNKMFR